MISKFTHLRHLVDLKFKLANNDRSLLKVDYWKFEEPQLIHVMYYDALKSVVALNNLTSIKLFIELIDKFNHNDFLIYSDILNYHVLINESNDDDIVNFITQFTKRRYTVNKFNYQAVDDFYRILITLSAMYQLRNCFNQFNINRQKISAFD